jgi:predicted SAM-dependent methyltransferase
MIKLHLGCDKRYIPGFIHIDISKYDHIDYCQSFTQLPMFEDNSVDLIYCCHAFPYLNVRTSEVYDTLLEWRRMLQPNGILRLSVTDFDKMIEVYNSSNRNVLKIMGPILGIWETTNTIVGCKSIYNRELLTHVLEKTGYINIRDWDWRTTEHAHIDDFSQAYYPHMDKEHGIMISLNIECSKPE